MMPIVGAKPRGVREQRGVLVVAAGHRLDVEVEDVLDELRVGAVDDEAQALRDERVVDALRLLLERQQALAAGALGHPDERA